ncbi:MAG: hypothetical protein GF403_11275 [Candidatus Coatesbacteria bacterium]|nr:hypothetical protein [Candidatus Coatesbacteria bacterium]
MDKSTSSSDRLTTASPRPRGLCADCVHAENCELRRMNPAPVYHCAEFVGLEAPPVIRAVRSEGPSAPLSRYRGLCRTCRRAERCTYPKPPGGVWYCEEYE